MDASRKRGLETVSLDFEVADDGPIEREVELDVALGKLPDELREAVELRYGSGLGVGEVARVLDNSRFSARRRISAALKMLEKELEEGDSDG